MELKVRPIKNQELPPWVFPSGSNPFAPAAETAAVPAEAKMEEPQPTPTPPPQQQQPHPSKQLQAQKADGEFVTDDAMQGASSAAMQGASSALLPGIMRCCHIYCMLQPMTLHMSHLDTRYTAGAACPDSIFNCYGLILHHITLQI